MYGRDFKPPARTRSTARRDALMDDSGAPPAGYKVAEGWTSDRPTAMLEPGQGQNNASASAKLANLRKQMKQTNPQTSRVLVDASTQPTPHAMGKAWKSLTHFHFESPRKVAGYVNAPGSKYANCKTPAGASLEITSPGALERVLMLSPSGNSRGIGTADSVRSSPTNDADRRGYQYRPKNPSPGQERNNLLAFYGNQKKAQQRRFDGFNTSYQQTYSDYGDLATELYIERRKILKRDASAGFASFGFAKDSKKIPFRAPRK